jgi:uncharacterized protein (DUF3084 family)
MKTRVLVLTLIVALSCLIFPAGCKDKQAAQQLSAVQAELAKVKDELAAAVTDRDSIKSQMEALTGNLEEAKTKLAEWTTKGQEMQDKITALTADKDKAVAEVQSKLQAEVKKALDLAQQNQQLKKLVEDLKSKLAGANIAIPALPQPATPAP